MSEELNFFGIKIQVAALPPGMKAVMTNDLDDSSVQIVTLSNAGALEAKTFARNSLGALTSKLLASLS